MLVKALMTTGHNWPILDNTTLEAEQLAFELGVFHLPVSHNDEYLGLLCIDNLTPDELAAGTPLTSFKSELQKVSIGPNAFVFDVFKVFVEGEYTALPVVNEQSELLGLFRMSDAINYLSKTLSIKNEGSFITLKLGNNDYNLQELARIVESNNARVLSLHFEPIENEEQLLCTIKINQRDLTHILATFERFGYEYVAHSSIGDHNDDLAARYNLLMKYLDL